MTYKQWKIEKSKDIRYKNLNSNIDGRFHYVYRITKDKHYYGSRVSSVIPKNDIGKKYFTSGVLCEDFKRNMVDYKIKIIKIFDNTRDKILFESYLHYKLNVKDNNAFANKSNQTPFGFDTTGVILSEEYKKRISITNTGIGNPFYNKKHTEKTVQKMKTAKSFKSVRLSKSTRLKMSKSKSKKRVPHTKERRDNISKSHIGSHWYKNPQGTECVRVQDVVAPCYTLFGWIPGRVYVKITCPHCGLTGNPPNLKRYHFNNCKHKSSGPL